ncbi:MAG TPA: MurR/RpiR family transcriptional regulator [Bryobacteraceae bacterium]|nr:MurR/RpiR family transcriptional regulator [Bryobacteraceae bacterium]
MEDDAKRPLLVYMQGILPSLNPTERLIAEYVLQDPERTLSSSIAEVRDGCGASVGSIVGFCRSLGLKGFADFKIAVARELAQSGFSGFGPDTDRNGAKSGSLFEKVFQFHAQSLMETLQINSQKTLNDAALAIDRARHIELFAIGMSYPVAYLTSCKLRLIGLPASTQADSHMQLIAATQLRKGDVAFGISCSGSTREVVHCLEVAQARGAKTICLTNSMKSPITECADYALFATPSEIKYFQAPLASRVTQLALVDALFVFLAQKHKDRTAVQLRNAGEELLKQRLT